MKRVPESINRLCEYLLKFSSHKKIIQENIDAGIQKIIEDSQSLYHHVYARFTPRQREVLMAIAKFGFISEPTSRHSLKEFPSITKSQVPAIFKSLMDDGVIASKIPKEGKAIFYFEDALLEEHIKRFYVI